MINEKINADITAFGDMKKSVYDTNNDGKVDSAESADSVPFSGVTDKPTTLSGYGIEDAYTKSETQNMIDTAISSTYEAGGSIAFASLPALTEANAGYVYNLSDDFTTTADFVEGSGKSYPAGTNVVIADLGNNTYKYDVLAGFVDLSDYPTINDMNTELAKKQNTLTFDNTPTNGSTNPGTSEGVYQADEGLSNRIAALEALGLSLVNGKVCQTYTED